jgi:hypothetical protein
MTQENQSPAFPFTEMHTHGSPYIQWKGMTLRDYFAAKAMQGLLASPRTPTEDKVVTDTVVAKYSYLMADAMLKARES